VGSGSASAKRPAGPPLVRFAGVRYAWRPQSVSRPRRPRRPSAAVGAASESVSRQPGQPDQGSRAPPVRRWAAEHLCLGASARAAGGRTPFQLRNVLLMPQGGRDGTSAGRCLRRSWTVAAAAWLSPRGRRVHRLARGPQRLVPSSGGEARRPCRLRAMLLMSLPASLVSLRQRS
jgi:hypothetical protein